HRYVKTIARDQCLAVRAEGQCIDFACRNSADHGFGVRIEVAQENSMTGMAVSQLVPIRSKGESYHKRTVGLPIHAARKTLDLAAGLYVPNLNILVAPDGQQRAIRGKGRSL